MNLPEKITILPYLYLMTPDGQDFHVSRMFEKTPCRVKDRSRHKNWEKGESEIKLTHIGWEFEACMKAKIETCKDEYTVAIIRLNSEWLPAGRTEDFQEFFSEHAVLLSDVYSFMKKQPNGEKGELNTDGTGNYFFVRDIDGDLKLVGLYWWEGSGWAINALSIACTLNIWRVGTKLFLRVPEGALNLVSGFRVYFFVSFCPLVVSRTSKPCWAIWSRRSSERVKSLFSRAACRWSNNSWISVVTTMS